MLVRSWCAAAAAAAVTAATVTAAAATAGASCLTPIPRTARATSVGLQSSPAAAAAQPATHLSSKCFLFKFPNPSSPAAAAANSRCRSAACQTTEQQGCGVLLVCRLALMRGLLCLAEAAALGQASPIWPSRRAETPPAQRISLQKGQEQTGGQLFALSICMQASNMNARGFAVIQACNMVCIRHSEHVPA